MTTPEHQIESLSKQETERQSEHQPDSLDPALVIVEEAVDRSVGKIAERVVATFIEAHEQRAKELEEVKQIIANAAAAEEKRDEKLHQQIQILLANFAAEEERKSEAGLRLAKRMAFLTERSAKFIFGTILLVGFSGFVIVYSDPADMQYQIRRGLPVVGTLWIVLIGYLLFGTKPPQLPGQSPLSRSSTSSTQQPKQPEDNEQPSTSNV